MPSIDKSRFVSVVPDEFICSICLNVFCYSATVEDDKGHDFCAACITEWLKIRKCCPLDNLHLVEAKLKPIGLGFKGLLEKLEVRCKYVNIGCGVTCKLESLADHEENCKCKSLKCKICGVDIKMDELNGHNCFDDLKNENDKLRESNLQLAMKVMTLEAVIELLTLSKNKNEAKGNVKQRDSAVPRFFDYNNNDTDSQCTDDTQSEASSSLSDRLISLGKKRLNYSANIANEYEFCKFAINKNGFVLVLCYNDNDYNNDGEFLLYNPRGKLLRKSSTANASSNDRIALTENQILYLEYFNGNQFTLNSYNFSFKKNKWFTRTVSHLTNTFNIDYSNNKIYVKIERKFSPNKFSYQTYALNRGLKLIFQFDAENTTFVNDLQVGNDLIVFYKRLSYANHSFKIKSLRTNADVQDFKLRLPTDICIQLGPNFELYILNLKRHCVEEYDLNDGSQMGSTTINTVPNFKNSVLRVSDNYDFLIGSFKNDGILYLTN